MKGLLLKDYYLFMKTCKSFLIIAVVFLGISLFADGNLFMIYYPCLYVTMMPMTLFSYDERSKWESYCATMPYTRGQLVSAKYLVGLIGTGVILLLTAGVQALRMYMNGGFDLNAYLALMGTLVSMCLVAPAISMPVLFRYGVEKGRMFYLLMMGFICGVSVLVAMIYDDLHGSIMHFNVGMMGVILICAGIYVFSWFLSIRIYQKRELK